MKDEVCRPVFTLRHAWAMNDRVRFQAQGEFLRKQPQ